MEENKHRHHHKTSKLHRFKRWCRHNKKWLAVIIVFLLIGLAFIIDSKKKNIPTDTSVNPEEVANSNYNAIITIVDGEGESTFTEVWGELIKEGYPICSTLVNNNVGKEGYMNWQTIEALHDVGVEFAFHTTNHVSYNNLTEEEIINDIQIGTKEMEEHGIKHDMFCWLGGTNPDLCYLGKNYFKCGIDDAGSISAMSGDKNSPLIIKNEVLVSNESYISLEHLKLLINQTISNNGWLIIYTRNNAPLMDSNQIDIYRQAFEYAKEHNVAVVTASEGFDLYYGNKLGNK